MNNSKRVTSYIKNGERSKQCLLNGIQMELDYEQAGCKDPKKLQGWEIGQINWNLTHTWAMNEQHAQAQKKLYNKIRYMPSKSSAVT